mgnify:CR=1 FL=1
MAKLSAGLAGKLKNMARDLKNDDNTAVKKSGDAKQSETRKKQAINDAKVSGRKN